MRGRSRQQGMIWGLGLAATDDGESWNRWRLIMEECCSGARPSGRRLLLLSLGRPARMGKGSSITETSQHIRSEGNVKRPQCKSYRVVWRFVRVLLVLEVMAHYFQTCSEKDTALCTFGRKYLAWETQQQCGCIKQSSITLNGQFPFYQLQSQIKWWF